MISFSVSNNSLLPSSQQFSSSVMVDSVLGMDSLQVGGSVSLMRSSQSNNSCSVVSEITGSQFVDSNKVSSSLGFDSSNVSQIMSSVSLGVNVMKLEVALSPFSVRDSMSTTMVLMVSVPFFQPFSVGSSVSLSVNMMSVVIVLSPFSV